MILISHRFSTTKDADQSCYMEKGQVAESGSQRADGQEGKVCDRKEYFNLPKSIFELREIIPISLSDILFF